MYVVYEGIERFQSPTDQLSCLVGHARKCVVRFRDASASDFSGKVSCGEDKFLKPSEAGIASLSRIKTLKSLAYHIGNEASDLETLDKIRERLPNCKVVVMTQTLN